MVDFLLTVDDVFVLVYMSKNFLFDARYFELLDTVLVTGFSVSLCALSLFWEAFTLERVRLFPVLFLSYVSGTKALRIRDRQTQHTFHLL